MKRPIIAFSTSDTGDQTEFTREDGITYKYILLEIKSIRIRQ